MGERLSPGLQKLLGEPPYGQVATLMSNGAPHLTQVWGGTSYEGRDEDMPARRH
jgi:hypothetical protein